MLERFRRITSGGDYLPQIDGLRFIAIAAVLSNHLASIMREHLDAEYVLSGVSACFYDLLRQGRFGVQLFFVISGFILAKPFLMAGQFGRPVDLRRYFRRRLLRLEPPYVLTLILYFVGLLLIGEYSFSELWPHFGASLGYFHNILYEEPSWINGVAWSLEVEVQFYLLVPLAITALRIKNAGFRRLLVMSILVIGYLSYQTLGLLASIVYYSHYFVLGILVADLHLSGLMTRQNAAFDVLLAACALLVVVYYVYTPFRLRTDLVVMLLFSVLFLAAFKGSITGRMLSTAWLSVVGGMCYSIYLLHAQIIGFLARFALTDLTLGLGFWTDYIVFCCIVLPVVLGASALFFITIERPCMHPDWPTRAMDFVKRAVRNESRVFR